MIYAYEFVCRDFILRTTRKIVGPPDSPSWWSCGPLLKKVCVKPCIQHIQKKGKKKNCLFPVTRPTLILDVDPSFFFKIFVLAFW